MRVLLTSLIVVALAACGANPNYLQQASQIMGKNSYCMSVITNEKAFGFNHVASAPLGGKVSASVATDGVNTVCGFATNQRGDVIVSNVYAAGWDDLDQVSLARCEKNRASATPKIQTPCRVFSHNYEVLNSGNDADVK